MATQAHEINVDVSNVTDQAKRFATNYRLARQKLEIAGLSQALGQALLEQRHDLPRARDFRSAERKRQQQVIESSLRQIRNQQERALLADQDEYIRAQTAELSDSWRAWVSEEMVELGAAAARPAGKGDCCRRQPAARAFRTRIRAARTVQGRQ